MYVAQAARVRGQLQSATGGNPLQNQVLLHNCSL